MKKVYLLVLSLAIVLFINACTDDEGNPVTNPNQLVPAMTATIDGTAWSATAPAAIDSAGIVFITGFSKDDSTSIVISISGPAETTYNFGDSAGAASAYYGGLSSGFNFATSGSLEITKYNAGQLISGNFNFASDSTLFGTAKTISDGRINNVVIVKR